MLRVLAEGQARHPAAALRRPWVPDGLAVHLAYGKELEPRLLVPPGLDRAAAAMVKPIQGRAVGDPKDIMGRLRRLEALGCEVTV